MYQRVQQICKAKNITVAKAEADLGFPRGSVYKWTDHKPSIEKVLAMAKYLGVTVEELTEGGLE